MESTSAELPRFMEQTQPGNSKATAPEIKERKADALTASVSRRRMIQAIVAAAPVMLTVMPRRVHAGSGRYGS